MERDARQHAATLVGPQGADDAALEDLAADRAALGFLDRLLDHVITHATHRRPLLQTPARRAPVPPGRARAANMRFSIPQSVRPCTPGPKIPGTPERGLRGSCSLSGGPAVARPVFGESGFVAPCAATRLTLSMRRAMLERGLFRIRIAYERRPLGGAGNG